jgi:N-methylhydantoinase A
MTMSASFKIGVDIGGTFTDITIVEEGGRITSHKTPSTPKAPAESVLRGITEALRFADLDPVNCASFVHGSTVGVNTIIQRVGDKVGVLVTKGFEDLLEIGRAKMPDPFSLFTMPPIPLVRRNWVRGVPERLDAKGRMLQPLDEKAVLAGAKELVDQGARSLAVIFINSYRNPAHEQRTRAILTAAFPEIEVAISSEIWPQIREYERATVTVMNSYISPTVKGYLAHLTREQKISELGCPLYVTSSNGGIVPIGHAMERPISTLLSGPASGIVAALELMRSCRIPRAITMDMGGTSADLSVLEGDAIPYAWDQEVAGLPITLPSVDISSIGAGGGSIAYADNLGLLRVGPQSAGADPGPVAYGKGGTEMTLTDAYLLSGFIDPQNFLGGRLPLDVDQSKTAMGKLAAALNIGPRETAQGVIKVATSNLAAEVTRLAAKKGIDIREFALLPFGGAGATHACLLADEMSVGHIAIPYSPGTFCATGSVIADFRLDYLKMIYAPVEKIDPLELEAWFKEVEAAAGTTLSEASSDVDRILTLRFAGARFQGQGYEVAVPFANLTELAGNFRDEYAKMYGPRNDDAPVEVINIRATVVGVTRKTPFAWAGGKSADARRGRRTVDLLDKEQECPVYSRFAMPPGWKMAGPFIIDQPDTTCVVTPGWTAEVDRIGTLHLTKGN